MSTVGAYIELRPGEDPPLHSFSCWMEADFHGKTPNGLEVSWEPREEEIPANAQVYLVWEPRVYAVWNEEEAENGEDGEYEDGSDVEQRDEEVPTQSDLGTGEGGAEPGDLQGFGDDGGSEEAEGVRGGHAQELCEWGVHGDWD